MNRLKQAALLILMLSQILAAQTNSNNYQQYSKNSFSNFVMGIRSNIDGIKKSCIYFAGKYKVKEAGQILIEEFDKTEEDNFQVLIIWSLSRIGDEPCIKKLKEILASSASEHVKLFCSSLLSIQEYGYELDEPHL